MDVSTAQVKFLTLALNVLGDRSMTFLRTIILPLVVVGAMVWLWRDNMTDMSEIKTYALATFGFFASCIVWIARK